MPPKRPLPPRSASSSSRPPPAPANVTRRLLQRFYRDVRVVGDLVDPETRLVRADDSVEFRKLVEETVFASVEEGQLPKLSVSESSFGSVSMSEVRAFPSLPVLLFLTLSALFQVVDQVQHRIFAAHAKVFHREKKAGRPAFATPKHTLTLGYRLVRLLRLTFPLSRSLIYASRRAPIVRRRCPKRMGLARSPLSTSPPTPSSQP
jgi:hypothetical protein